MSEAVPKNSNSPDPITAPGSPKKFRARVRMYRQGLGDCFLITFTRKGRDPFQMLIDCGALARSATQMKQLVEHIRDTVREESEGKALLDVVVATHEHKDHLSGFNQARSVFNNDFEFGGVWLAWTENLTRPEIKRIKQARTRAKAKLQSALASSYFKASGTPADDMKSLLLFGEDAPVQFSDDDDSTESRKIADAMEYLKVRGKEAKDLRYLEPGDGPFELDGVKDVRVYVLGPPRDPMLLKSSKVTEQMKRDNVIYHLSAAGEASVDAVSAALGAADAAPGTDEDRYHPFAIEHRIAQYVSDPLSPGYSVPSPYYAGIQPFVKNTYEDPKQSWRRIDDDWLSAFSQLALDLDSDTNNSSLVLAFEFVKSREVLLFVGDAQVGNWQSWANVEFRVPGQDRPLPAHDLLRRTVFYKVGHHCSHNATLKEGGLEIMEREDLVAFIPLDKQTAASQGRIDPASGKHKGWEMPASVLFKRLKEKTENRVVISDVQEHVSPEAKNAGVIVTGTYVDYFVK